jgi:ubiquinone/menaquinone biosynthesis C-methylase UbiE
VPEGLCPVEKGWIGMGTHVCPWWMGYLLVSPLRAWLEKPEKILAPHVSRGMTVLDIGPGMGFFTIPAARLVGPEGRVIAVDVQEKMLKSLIKRARKAGVADRVVARVCEPETLGVVDPVDLCLLINVAHEVPDVAGLFAQVRAVLKPSGRVLLAEPSFHVSEAEFGEAIRLALASGLMKVSELKIRSSLSVLLAAA